MSPRRSIHRRHGRARQPSFAPLKRSPRREHRGRRHSGLAGLGPSRSRAPFFVLLGLVIVVVAAAAAGLVRYLGAVPPPTLAVSAGPFRFSGTPPVVTWPTGAEGTLVLGGVGAMATSASQPETPIASVTKMMAAYVILRDHPLKLGESGPSLTVTAADVATYRSELAQGDSVVAVAVGEQISEYEALEATLVPSGDNIIAMLATWDAGSIANFVVKMNDAARALRLTSTHYAEPSGVDPRTVSTARDQVALAEVALRNPVFAHIVSLVEVNLPVAGLQYNVDADLGKNGIVGVKTGWIPAGGASFVFVAHQAVAGRPPVTVLGGVVGVQGRTPLPSALDAALGLVTTARAAVRVEVVVRQGQAFGTLRAPYSSAVPVVAARGASLVGWPGARVVETMAPRPGLVAPVPSGTVVGYVTFSLGTEHQRVALETGGALAGPSLSWRIRR